jgi:hypothetical protein
MTDADVRKYRAEIQYELRRLIERSSWVLRNPVSRRDVATMYGMLQANAGALLLDVMDKLGDERNADEQLADGTIDNSDELSPPEAEQ